MKINEILEDPSRYVGIDVEVEGVFIFGQGVCQLMEDDYEKKPDPIGISVRHEDIRKILFRTVPAFGGGKLAYCHHGVLRGKLLPSKSGPLQYEIACLTYMLLRTDRAEFVVVQ